MRCKLFCLILVFLILGCATENKQDPTEPPPKLSTSEYKAVVDKYSRKDEQYQGFQNTFFIVATLMTSEMWAEQLDQKRFYFQWDPVNFGKQRDKVMQKQSSTTEVFLSFYSPIKEHNDLNKASSIWKVYLEVDGQRYEGKVEKAKEKYVELADLYPYHPRWSTGYHISFSVPTSAAERGAKFTLTSSLGQTQFVY